MDRGLALSGIPEISPGRAEIFHINRTKRARHFGGQYIAYYFNRLQKEVVTGIKMSGPLAKASPPVNLPCKMGMKKP